MAETANINVEKKGRLFLCSAFLFFLILCCTSACTPKPALSYPIQEEMARQLAARAGWDFVEYQAWDASHRMVYLKNSEEISCIMDLQEDEVGEEPARRASAALVYPPVMRKEEEVPGREFWSEIGEILPAFYGMGEDENALWKEFLDDAEHPVDLEGYQWIWTGRKGDTHLEITMKRTGSETPWQMERATLRTEAWAGEESRKKAGELAGIPDYVRYQSVGLLEADRGSMTGESKGYYGEVTGTVSGIYYTDRLPEGLAREFYGHFPGGREGYRKGLLHDSEGEMEIWILPGLDLPEGGARYQLGCFPGREGTVMLIRVLEQ